MPVIKSARKKLKVDRKREGANKKATALVNLIIHKAQKKPTTEVIQKAFKAIDKAVKNKIFHKNKGARMKAALSKLLTGKSTKTVAKSSKAVKETTKRA